MMYELSNDDILKIINGNCVGSGVYGKVYEYDDTTLIKIYYKDIFNFFASRSIADLDRDVDVNLYVENEMLGMRDDYVTKLDRLVNIVSILRKANCSLIKGIVLYHGYPVGIILNYYKGYSKLGEVYEKLDDQSKLVVVNKIKSILYHLFDCGIYPLDLKENNILVDVKTLDVQFIDLDGDETKYESKDYVKEDAVKSFEFMKQRLNSK